MLLLRGNCMLHAIDGFLSISLQEQQTSSLASSSGWCNCETFWVCHLSKKKKNEKNPSHTRKAAICSQDLTQREIKQERWLPEEQYFMTIGYMDCNVQQGLQECMPLQIFVCNRPLQMLLEIDNTKFILKICINPIHDRIHICMDCTNTTPRLVTLTQ